MNIMLLVAFLLIIIYVLSVPKYGKLNHCQISVSELFNKSHPDYIMLFSIKFSSLLVMALL